MKINDIHACTQELIGGGEVRISLIKLGSFICLMSIGMDHGGEGIHRRSTEVIKNSVGTYYFILNVEVELLQVCEPLMMEVILQFSLGLHEQ